MPLGLVSSCLLVLISAGGGMASGQTSTTTAPSPPGLSPVDPGPHGYFQYTVAPGGTAEGSARLSNPGPAAGTFKVFAADGLTSSATGVVYSEAGAPLSATGTWIGLSDGQVTLGPGQSRLVSFQVKVPTTAWSGDHVAAIAAQNVSTSEAGGSTPGGTGISLKVNTRVVVAVVVRVPGPATTALRLGAPSIVAVDGSRQVVDLPMDHPGGLLFKPGLKAAVSDCSGRPLSSIDRQLDTFVPHTSITYEWSLSPRILPSGCYVVTATAFDGATPLSQVRQQVTVSPSVASVNPSGPGPSRPNPPHPTAAPRSSAFLLGLVGGLAILLLAIVTGLTLFVIWWRRRQDEEDEREEERADSFV